MVTGRLFCPALGGAVIDSNIMLDMFGMLIVSVILLADSKRGRERTTTRALRQLMLCCLAVLALDIAGLLCDGRSFRGAKAILWVLNTGYWLAQIVICPVWLSFTAEWCLGQKRIPKKATWLLAIPFCATVGLIITNPWTGHLFSINSENLYETGSAYAFCLIPFYFYITASVCLAAYGVLRAADSAGRRNCLTLLAYMLLPICGVVMESISYGISWVFPMVALSILMIYMHLQQAAIMTERVAVAQAAETAAQMHIEMTNNRMAIMLSQIQPHFLYNALCVIQDLCHDKAPDAEQATIAFSRFLRGNMDSLNAKVPIPFAEELSHTRYYLTMETLRFGERLRVEYDIQADRFFLPALTLQPIVENAVRYGVTQRESGGTVRISAKETDDAYVVTVEDDGVGFDPLKTHADGRTHIGIENVRLRLREMCGGALQIVCAPGEGTRASIVLPKGGNDHAHIGG